MAIATYRGVKYDTEKHKSSFLSWWNQIHCDATRWFSYRGLRYRAFDSCKKKDLRVRMEECPGLVCSGPLGDPAKGGRALRG
jgi:hypothetical protein